MRTRVKICGITRQEDLLAAARAGADAVGLVLYPGSKRFVDIARAAELRRAAPPWVTVTVLLVNAEPDFVREVIGAVRPHLLQFHGDETPDDCDRHDFPYMRAFRVGAPGLDSAAGVAQACSGYRRAAAWLFDSYSPGYGGSGVSFDRALLAELPAQDARPIVLSGGLTTDTVGDAVRALRPWGVDVSSGVEDAPGVKSHAKIHAFIDAVARADALLTVRENPV